MARLPSVPPRIFTFAGVKAEAAVSAVVVGMGVGAGGNRCTEEAAAFRLIHQPKPAADMRNEAPHAQTHTEKRKVARQEPIYHPEPAILASAPLQGR